MSPSSGEQSLLSVAGPAEPAQLVRRRVVLVDDHPLVREGLAKLIDQQPDLCVCGNAEEPREAYETVVRERPDAVILDLSLRNGSGLDLIKEIHELPRPPCILVLSMHDEAFYADRAIRAGAMGYVMKRESSGKIVEGLRRVLEGGLFVSDSVRAQAAEKFFGRRAAADHPSVERLSDRELEIFRRIGQGEGTRGIAVVLHLSIKTVQTHCAHIKDKLGLANAALLMREAVRWVESERRG